MEHHITHSKVHGEIVEGRGGQRGVYNTKVNTQVVTAHIRCERDWASTIEGKGASDDSPEDLQLMID